MPIILQNDLDPALVGSIDFLSAQSQQQAAAQAAEEERRRREREQADNNLAALMQAAQFAQQQPPPAPVAPQPNIVNPYAPPQMTPAIPGPAATAQSATTGSTGGGGGGYDRQPRGHGGAAGAAFLGQQAKAMGVASAAASRAMAGMAGEQAKSNAAIQVGFAKAQQEREAVLAKQQQAELVANLKQRNKLMQTAPGIIDPAAISQSQARIQANQDALTYPARMARQKLMERIATGDPAAVQEGLAQGLLAFTPEQQTRIKQLKEAMAQVDIDPNLAPWQRGIAERSLAEQLNSIRPMEVPSDQQPLSPVEEFQNGAITVPDHSTGMPLTYRRVIRNGEETWQIDDASKEALQLWKEKELRKWDLENGIHHEEAKAKAFARDVDSWKAEEPKPPKAGDFKKLQKGEDGSPDTWVPDAEAYAKAVEQYNNERVYWQTKKPKTEREMALEAGQGWMTSMNLGMGGATTGFSAEFPNDPPPPSEADTDMATAFGGDPAMLSDQTAGPTVLSPHDDGTAQWDAVPVGGTTTLPDGTPVRKTGPTSYVRL